MPWGSSLSTAPAAAACTERDASVHHTSTKLTIEWGFRSDRAAESLRLFVFYLLGVGVPFLFCYVLLGLCRPFFLSYVPSKRGHSIFLLSFFRGPAEHRQQLDGRLCSSSNTAKSQAARVDEFGRLGVIFSIIWGWAAAAAAAASSGNSGIAGTKFRESGQGRRASCSDEALRA